MNVSKKLGSLVVIIALLASAIPTMAQGQPPKTTIEISPQLPVWGWHVTNVTVTLNATDDDGDLNATYYRIDEGNWSKYTEPFIISTPGNHKIEYYSVDDAGNNETSSISYIPIANLSSAMRVTPTTANWNETKKIEVWYAEGTVYLYAPREDTPRYSDTGGYIRWSNVLLNISGQWWIIDIVNATKANAVAIDVKPVELLVNATPDEVNYVKLGKSGCYVNIEGNVTMAGQPATQAKVKLIYPDGSSETKNVGSDGSFSFLDINIGQRGAGIYNVTAFIGDEQYPDASGYDIVNVKTVAPNISLISNDAIGGFDIGKVVFEITYPEDGLQLLPESNYSLSIYKGGNLYAWKNNTASNETKISFVIDGKFLNLTSPTWEDGNYLLKVNVDVTRDGNWEYVGEKDFSVPAAPAVNIKVLEPLDKIMNVLEPNANKQVIKIQIFGENMTTYGTPQALNIGTENENVTDRIKVEGNVLYSPPKNAYNHSGNGIWEIYVFPIKGNGFIYINVTWPEKGEAKETINISEGGVAKVEPKTVIVDTPTNIEIEVKDKYGNPVANANVKMYYEENLYQLGEVVENGTISGDGSQGKGLNGKYNFTITSKSAGENIIVAVDYVSAVGTQYAYARIESRAAHDLNVSLAPSKVLAGENTEFIVNITKNGQAYSDNFEFYILNETELQELHDGTITMPLPVYTTSNANSTFKYAITKDGKYYLYVRTVDKKHDNMESEPSFGVTMAEVTASPSLLVKNVDKNTTVSFNVIWNEKPLNGTLLIKGINSTNHTWINDSIEITIVDGIGNVTEVNATAIGNITFEFKSAEAGSNFAEADGLLRVTTPTVEIVEPVEKVAFLAEENLITILVKHPLTNAGIGGMNVGIVTPMGAMNVGKTGANGKLLFGILPLQTGKIEIIVEGDTAGSIDIAIGLKIITPELEKGKEAVITVTTRGGKAVAGAKVTIDGKRYATDANGEIKFTLDKEGIITIVAEKEGYYSTTKTVEVKAGAKAPGFEMIGIAIAIFAAIFLIRRRK